MFSILSSDIYKSLLNESASNELSHKSSDDSLFSLQKAGVETLMHIVERLHHLLEVDIREHRCLGLIVYVPSHESSLHSATRADTRAQRLVGVSIM